LIIGFQIDRAYNEDNRTRTHKNLRDPSKDKNLIKLIG
jgi:hypothetical protein